MHRPSHLGPSSLLPETEVSQRSVLEKQVSRKGSRIGARGRVSTIVNQKQVSQGPSQSGLGQDDRVRASGVGRRGKDRLRLGQGVRKKEKEKTKEKKYQVNCQSVGLLKLGLKPSFVINLIVRMA